MQLTLKFSRAAFWRRLGRLVGLFMVELIRKTAPLLLLNGILSVVNNMFSQCAPLGKGCIQCRFLILPYQIQLLTQLVLLRAYLFRVNMRLQKSTRDAPYLLTR